MDTVNFIEIIYYYNKEDKYYVANMYILVV